METTINNPVGNLKIGPAYGDQLKECEDHYEGIDGIIQYSVFNQGRGPVYFVQTTSGYYCCIGNQVIEGSLRQVIEFMQKYDHNPVKV